MSFHIERTSAWSGILLFGLTTTTACNELGLRDSANDDPGEAWEARLFAPPEYPDASLPDDVGHPGPGPVPYFSKGVVATSDSLASAAGREVLAKGGDALDAAAVVQAMLSVSEPQSSGLGGGALWLVYLADLGKNVVIDCRERAPGEATADMLLGGPSLDLKSTSGISVGVPGTLHCMHTALALRPGGLTLGQALEPALAAASDGIVVSSRLASDSHSDRLSHELDDPAYMEARAVFRPGGEALDTGDTLQQPALAYTLKQVQQGGLAAFYDCKHPSGIAAALIETQEASRSGYPEGAGRMSCGDLLAFAPVLRAPLKGSYHGYTIVTTPPPSSGVSLLQMLGMLEHFELGKGEYGFGQHKTLNVMQEVMRMAFADRSMWLGDPDEVKVPLKGLLASSYLEQRVAQISPGKRLDDIDPGDPRLHEFGGAILGVHAQDDAAMEPEGIDTSHFVVADSEGNVVSVTTTVADKWGTGLMVKGRGFLLNNQLLNFNDVPTYSANPYDPGANDIAPFKRPRTALTPTLVFLGGKPIAAFGSPGGGAILNTVFQFLVNLADHRMTLQQAVAAPRFSLESSNDPWDTMIEAGFSADVQDSLEDLGYDFAETSEIGAVQAVIINNHDQRKYGTADPRRKGVVEGL